MLKKNFPIVLQSFYLTINLIRILGKHHGATTFKLEQIKNLNARQRYSFRDQAINDQYEVFKYKIT